MAAEAEDDAESGETGGDGADRRDVEDGSVEGGGADGEQENESGKKFAQIHSSRLFSFRIHCSIDDWLLKIKQISCVQVGDFLLGLGD